MNKHWISVLLQMPQEGRIVECLVINFDEVYAGYSKAPYQWYKSEWVKQGKYCPTLGEGVVITHWLQDPEPPLPLPAGWPDCPIEKVHNYLEPYIRYNYGK